MLKDSPHLLIENAVHSLYSHLDIVARLSHAARIQVIISVKQRQPPLFRWNIAYIHDCVLSYWVARAPSSLLWDSYSLSHMSAFTSDARYFAIYAGICMTLGGWWRHINDGEANLVISHHVLLFSLLLAL